jgi:hypothetical protein
MKTGLLIFFFATSILCGDVSFVFKPIKKKPDFNRAADYIQDRYSGMTISKEKFISALKAGRFGTNHTIVYDEDFAEHHIETSGLFGVITLDDGTLFKWSIPKKGVIELVDSNYRTGYIFYPKGTLGLNISE